MGWAATKLRSLIARSALKAWIDAARSAQWDWKFFDSRLEGEENVSRDRDWQEFADRLGAKPRVDTMAEYREACKEVSLRGVSATLPTHATVLEHFEETGTFWARQASKCAPSKTGEGFRRLVQRLRFNDGARYRRYLEEFLIGQANAPVWATFSEHPGTRLVDEVNRDPKFVDRALALGWASGRRMTYTSYTAEPAPRKCVPTAIDAGTHRAFASCPKGSPYGRTSGSTPAYPNGAPELVHKAFSPQKGMVAVENLNST